MVKPRDTSARKTQLSESSRIDWFRLVPEVIGGLTIFIGLMVVLGWYEHWMSVIRPLPTLAPMQFNTAFGFTLCGAGLLLLSRDAPWR